LMASPFGTTRCSSPFDDRCGPNIIAYLDKERMRELTRASESI